MRKRNLTTTADEAPLTLPLRIHLDFDALPPPLEVVESWRSVPADKDRVKALINQLLNKNHGCGHNNLGFTLWLADAGAKPGM